MVHFLRPAGAGNYSIEGTFESVRRSALAKGTKIDLVRLPYANTGLISRIRNGIYAWRRRGDVNHVLGDVHYLILFLPKMTALLTICDCVFAYHPDRIKRTILRLFWLHIPVRAAGAVTVISEKSRREVLELTGARRREMAVIPVCVADCFTYKPRPFNSTRPRILQVGTRPNKNVLRLVNAIAGLDVILELIGTVEDSLRDAMDANGIRWESQCEVLEGEILAAYERCDIVAFVSTYEGFGLPIVEGQSVGRVVVTSDIEPMREVAGGAAILVDPESVASIRAGVLRVIGDVGLRETLIRKGLANAARYRSEVITAEYLRLYQMIGTGTIAMTTTSEIVAG